MSGVGGKESGGAGGAPRRWRAHVGDARGGIAATAGALALLLAGAYLACREIDAWAATAFARPALASALLAARDLAVLLVALCLAPPISALLHLPLDAGRKTTNGSTLSARGRADRERPSPTTGR